LETIEIETLRSLRGSPAALRDYAGSLAPWLMAGSCAVPPMPHCEPGSAIALLVWEPAIAGGSLGRAFALPLRWRRGDDGDPGLPESLRETGRSIQRRLGLSGWCLRRASELASVDLSRLHLACDSAEAPLAAALVVAAEGGEPEPLVFGTGVLSDGHVDVVDELQAKVELVGRLAAGREAWLFVPRAHFAEAEAAAAPAVKVAAYAPMREGDLRAALAPHLARLEAPPPESAPLEVRLAYANRRYLAPEQRYRYYSMALARDIARRATPPGRAPVDRLATSLSLSWELTHCILHLVRPREALLLWSDDTHRHLEQITAMRPPETRILPHASAFRPDDARLVGDDVARWLAESDAPAVDITPGQRLMSLALEYAARLAEARVFYLIHEWRPRDAGGGVAYGTERHVTIDWLSETSGRADAG